MPPLPSEEFGSSDGGASGQSEAKSGETMRPERIRQYHYESRRTLMERRLRYIRTVQIILFVALGMAIVGGAVALWHLGMQVAR